jgi:heme-degrading monooxygenase HmoA
VPDGRKRVQGKGYVWRTGRRLSYDRPGRRGRGVIDVWETRDAFDEFFASRLQPAMQELGDRTFQTPPDIKEFPVHHLIKP